MACKNLLESNLGLSVLKNPVNKVTSASEMLELPIILAISS
jgi:hypothetical protein